MAGDFILSVIQTQLDMPEPPWVLSLGFHPVPLALSSIKNRIKPEWSNSLRIFQSDLYSVEIE